MKITFTQGSSRQTAPGAGIATPTKNHDNTKPTALITGSAKRIGKYMAIHLAAKGWNLALHYNTSDKSATRLQKELQKDYPHQEFAIFGSNLQNPFAVEQLIGSVTGALGRLDLLINNAAVFERSSIQETHFDLLDKLMMINYRAPFLLIRDFARLAGKGQVINMLDTRITTSQFDYAAYNLSKKALWELTKMAALEFAPDMRINAIAPGAILPPADKDESYLRHLASKTPMQTPVGLEPLLQSLDYILDNAHLTGQVLFCDGGQNLI